MTKLVIGVDTTHPMYKEYVLGRINGIASGIIYATTNNLDDVKRHGMRKKEGSNTKILTFAVTDDQSEMIINVLDEVYNSRKFAGLLKFSGTYEFD